MTARILDGTATLRTIKTELAERVTALKERGITPGLGTVLVGDDPGSRWYVAAKHRDCAQIGIRSIQRELPAGTGQAEVEAVVDELNADPECTAFLVQLPTGRDHRTAPPVPRADRRSRGRRSRPRHHRWTPARPAAVSPVGERDRHR